MYYDLLANLTTTMQLLTGAGGNHHPHRRACRGGRLIELLDVLVALVVVLDREAELDHAVDARGERGGLVEREARREERGLEEEVDEVLDRLVALFAADFALSSFMIECFGLISIVFFDAMYDDIELSRSACARMIRSMLAVQPY